MHLSLFTGPGTGPDHSFRPMPLGGMAWLKRHPWFEAEVLPRLRERIKRVLGAPDAA